MEVVIKEVKNRGVLNEGRSTGIAFAFLKKVADNKFETVIPMSPCKDYLNEVVFTENTGIPTQACGLKYPAKLDIFNDVAYLGIKIVTECGNDDYSYSNSIEKDKEYLRKNYSHMQALANHIEEQFKMKDRTLILPANEDQFLIIVPIEWTTSTYMISLYTLLLRVAMVYDGVTDVYDFLNNYNYNNEDKHLLSPVMKQLKEIIAMEQLPVQDYNEQSAKKGWWTPHGYGILYYIREITKKETA